MVPLVKTQRFQRILAFRFLARLYLCNSVRFTRAVLGFLYPERSISGLRYPLGTVAPRWSPNLRGGGPSVVVGNLAAKFVAVACTFVLNRNAVRVGDDGGYGLSRLMLALNGN